MKTQVTHKTKLDRLHFLKASSSPRISPVYLCFLGKYKASSYNLREGSLENFRLEVFKVGEGRRQAEGKGAGWQRLMKGSFVVATAALNVGCAMLLPLLLAWHVACSILHA